MEEPASQSRVDGAEAARRRQPYAQGFRLLYVCTGNICRSPFAEMLTRHLLVGRLGGRAAAAFDVSSAGVQALVGARVHPDMLDQLNPWGLDRIATGRFVAQQLRSTMIGQADLVLGMNPRHRSAIVELVPTAVATAFSLREFARLAAAVDQEALPADPVPRAHALVAQAHRHRGMVAASPDEDQLPDSTSCPPAGPDHAAVLIRGALQTIVDVIAPRRRRVP